MKTATINGQMHSTSIDLETKTRTSMVAVLNQHLADTFDLMSQTKQAHWNVKGEHFYSLHLLFDQSAEVLEGHVDEIAERVTALGGTANGTVRMSAEQSRLKEFPDTFAGMECVRALVERWSAHTGHVRSAITEATDAGDDGTADLFTEIVRELDKYLWFLEAHLQARA